MKNVFERMLENDTLSKISSFEAKQKQPYWFKKRYAEIRAKEFVSECERRGLNYHCSIGGLDSIILYVFLRYIGINDVVPISVSSLENASNRKVHRAIKCEMLLPSMRPDGTRWTKAKVLQELGFPVISKEKAAKIELLQNPTEKNKTVRHAIITGETGEYGGFQKNSRMKLPQKWLELFGGYENQRENVNYKKPDFKVSSKCCYYLKEKPCNDWARDHNSVPFMGLMASEGGRREKSLKINGCNYFGKSEIRSCPFAIFDRQDILKLALEMDKWYQGHYSEIGCEYIDTIVPTIYGTIESNEKGELYTTGAQRTGCEICGFGIHLEQRPHRFDKMYKENPKAWQYWMYECCTDVDGEKYGWGKVLSYCNVGWNPEDLDNPQLSFFEVPEMR